MSSSPSSAAYAALRRGARRKIYEEWDITGREQTVLGVIEELSFGRSLRDALIPTQVKLARACGLHKSDVCRALGRLIRIGALSRTQHLGQTRYALQLSCKDVPTRTAITEADRKLAMAELIEIQDNRHGGTADARGQQFIHGIFEPQDADLEREALNALMEEPSPPASDPEEAPDPQEVARELEGLRRRLDAPAAAVAAPAPQGKQKALDALKRGLSPEQAYLWDRLVVEMQRGTGKGWQSFVQWAGKWRKRLLDDPEGWGEAIGDHKLRTLGPADEPGAMIYDIYMRRSKPVFTGSG